MGTGDLVQVCGRMVINPEWSVCEQWIAQRTGIQAGQSEGLPGGKAQLDRTELGEAQDGGSWKSVHYVWRLGSNFLM